MQDVRPGADAIALHEIHLARQSSLQVPVGHIPVPGGIKLCSPGTFLVANYLIINNGSYQVNFTKPNSATIRYTNSQSLREDATEASVGRVAVPKTGQKTPFATRGWLWSTCGQGRRVEDRSRSGLSPVLERLLDCSARRDVTGVPVGMVPVPKTGQKTPSPRGDATEGLVGRVAVPKSGRRSI